MTEPATPRRRPCASCPYRQNAPSGVWHPEEYEKLPRYDLPMPEQPPAVFMCHQRETDREICSGWLGHSDPADLLAVRIGVMSETVDPCALEYTTDVPLFDSGTAAAEHGLRDVDLPTAEAVTVIDKLVRKRNLTVD